MTTRKNRGLLGAALCALLLVSPTPLPAAGSGSHESAHAPDASALTGHEALRLLQEGNQRYVAGAARHGEQDAHAREALTGGQSPRAIVLGCSDSRVPPELVFDQGLGEVFVIRVAGNVLGNASVASIEYAVEHLGAPLLVIMGHESCGAVGAALDTEPQDAGSLDLYALLAAIRPNIKPYLKNRPDDPRITAPVKANVEGVMEKLLQRSKIVREHTADGRLLIAPAIYEMASGEVDFWQSKEAAIATRAKPATHH